MNVWDYHLLKISIIPLIISIIWLYIIIASRKTLKRTFCNFIDWIKSELFGDLYLVRVNGVWSSYRGKLIGGKLKIKYGKDKHIWYLDYEDFIPPSKTEIKNLDKCVIEKNIESLKERNRKIIINDMFIDWMNERRRNTE